MNRLFVELYLDEDVDVLVAELLRSYGFKATTARETEHLGKSFESFESMPLLAVILLGFLLLEVLSSLAQSGDGV